MPAESKPTKKDIKKLQKKLKLIAREAKKLDCHLRDVARAVANGNFRML
jgi:ABC-type metal ion transport system substrate-binding protein